MNYSQVQFIQHVTTSENADSILKTGFRLNKAPNHRFSGVLSSREDAPLVVYLSASYYNDQLPTISLFPYKDCKKGTCPSYSDRILLSSSILTSPTSNYKVFFVQETESGHYKNRLYYFVQSSNQAILDWCKAEQLEEYNLFEGAGPDRPMYVENGLLFTRAMKPDGIIVQLAFSEDFADHITKFQRNRVGHICIKHDTAGAA